MKTLNAIGCKLTTTASGRACVIILGLGLVLLMNACATSPVKHEFHADLYMIPEEMPKDSLTLVELVESIDGKTDHEKILYIFEQEVEIFSKCGIKEKGN